MTPAELKELAELEELEQLERKYAAAPVGTRQHREVPGAGYRPESPQQPLPPTPIGTDILTGLRTAGRNIGKNIGIPGTDIDLNALLERFGARPIAEVRQDYESAGWPAGLSRFGTELGVTAPLGGGLVQLLRGAGATIPAGANAVGNLFSRLASKPLVGRTLRAATEGAVAGALTGEGEGARDAATGAVGGVVGERLIRGLGRVATGFPAISEEAATLLKNKIPVTIGQAMPDTATGRFVRGTEDAATSIPLVGDIMTGLRGRGAEALRGTAVSSALPPGMRLPRSAKTQPLKALKEIGVEFSKRYQSALNPVPPGSLAVPGGVTAAGLARQPVPPGFADATVAKAFSDPDAYISPDRLKHAQARIRSAVDFKAMSPDQIFKAQSDLRGAARKLASRAASTAEDDSVANAYRLAADDLLEGLEAGLPRGAELQSLRGPYRNYVNLLHETEKMKGFGETLTPTGIRRSASRAKNRRLEALARSAESVLPSRLPDSGTARRAAQMLLTGGAGGYAFDPSMLAVGLGAGAGLMAPALLSSTQTGTKYLLGQYPWQKALEGVLGKYGATAGGILAQ